MTITKHSPAPIKEGVLKRRRITCGMFLSKNQKTPIIDEEFMTIEHNLINKWYAHYVTASGASNGYYQIKDCAFVVATLHDYFDIEKGSIVKKENDARLIAAAPDLLEALAIALKEMQAAANNMVANGYEAAALPVQLLRHAASVSAEAINKAEGK